MGRPIVCINSTRLPAAEGGRAALAVSQVSRLVALCAEVLRESARETQDLSDRLSALREDIESLSGDARLERAFGGQGFAPGPRTLTCRRIPKCHANPLFGSPCDCRSGSDRQFPFSERMRRTAGEWGGPAGSMATTVKTSEGARRRL
jgi:hypothetical protein